MGGSSSAQIIIQTERPNYSAGETVVGKVYLNATAETNAESLNVTVWGRERTCVHYTRQRTTGSGKNRKTRTTHHYARATRSLLSVDIPICTFPDAKIQPGAMFEFPIQVQLPPGLPSTMSVSGRSNCDIQYGISARLHTTGWFSWDVRASHAFVVQRTPFMQSMPLPLYARPNSQDVRFCCCINRGSMCLCANASSSIVTRSSPLQIGLACENQSTSPVQGVQIEVKESLSWRARGHSASTERIIAQQTLNPSAVQGTDAVARKMSMKSGSADYALQNIARQLQSGEQGATLQISPEARDSYNGNILDVKHTVRVVLQTGTCITDPIVEMPLVIQPMLTEQGAAIAPPPLLQDMKRLPDEQAVPQMPQGWAPQNQAQMFSIPINTYQIGGTAQDVGGDGDSEDETDPDPLAALGKVQMPLEAPGPSVTVSQLLAELDHTFDDVGAVQGFSQRAPQAVAALTPDDVVSILSLVQLPSFRVDASHALLSKVPGGPTCALVAAAQRATGDLYNSQTVQRLAPLIAPQELAANRNIILQSMNDFDRLICGPALGL